MGGEMLELVADLGPKPFASARLRSVNAVLRATSSDVHVDLLELPGGEGARYARLPVALTPREIIRRGSLLIARRVFSTGGRSIDLSCLA